MQTPPVIRPDLAQGLMASPVHSQTRGGSCATESPTPSAKITILVGIHSFVCLDHSMVRSISSSATGVSLTSPSGKFFRFPGPFFAPDTTRTNFDHFVLSETHSKLIDITNRKIVNVRTNLETTGRFGATPDAATIGDSDAEVSFRLVELSCPLLILSRRKHPMHTLKRTDTIWMRLW